MKNLNNYREFINENDEGFLSGLASYFRTFFSSIFGDDSDDSAKSINDLDIDEINVKGNDDFVLYLIHQQGLAGITGIIKQMRKTGNFHPSTIKTKNGVKYSNLVSNMPSDKPEAKKKLISLLDAKKYSKAAALFLMVWKEKWNTLYKQAQIEINKPQNKEVKKAILKNASEFGIPKDFAFTVSYIESRFNPKSGNSTYKGLFALDPNSNYDGVLNYSLGNKWSNPYYNSKAGLKLMKSSINRFKSSIGNELSQLKFSNWIKSFK